MIDHMVNFAKLRQVADIIRAVSEYQQEDYNFTQIKPIEDWIYNLPEYDEVFHSYLRVLRAVNLNAIKFPLGRDVPTIT